MAVANGAVSSSPASDRAWLLAHKRGTPIPSDVLYDLEKRGLIPSQTESDNATAEDRTGTPERVDSDVVERSSPPNGGEDLSFTTEEEEVVEQALPAISPTVHDGGYDIIASLPASEVFPERMGRAAFNQSLVRDLLGFLAPKTDASIEAMLVVFLTEFGTLCGRGPVCYYGGAYQRPSVFTVLVGDSGRGRKGTAMNIVEQTLTHIVPDMRAVIHSGLGSGEGLVKVLAESIKNDPDQMARVLMVEEEFARLLKAAARDQSTVSERIRTAFDGKTLMNATTKGVQRVDEYHMGLIANITREDLHDNVNSTDIANGYANRMLWVPVRKRDGVKVGGDPWVLPDALVDGLDGALRFAQSLDGKGHVGNVSVVVSDDAFDALNAMASEREVLTGIASMLSRRSHVIALRLALIYALLDKSSVIASTHVESARAVVEYAERGLRWVFGDATGDRWADLLLRHVDAHGPMTGRARKELVRDPMKRQEAVDRLLSLGLCRMVQTVPGAGGGRPVDLLCRASS